MDLLCL